MTIDTSQHDSLSLEQSIEALLFYKAEPVSFESLLEILTCSAEECAEALVRLEQHLQGRGIQLVRDAHMVELVTAPEANDLITNLSYNDLKKNLSKAGLETLTIILYYSPVNRQDIDYIRGVNSSQILRNLLIRGLIQKREIGIKQTIVYEPTIDLYKYLGISHAQQLPNYDSIRAEIQNFFDVNEQT